MSRKIIAYNHSETKDKVHIKHIKRRKYNMEKIIKMYGKVLVKYHITRAIIYTVLASLPAQLLYDYCIHGYGNNSWIVTMGVIDLLVALVAVSLNEKYEKRLSRLRKKLESGV